MKHGPDRRGLIITAILLFAFSMRPAVNSLGAVVPELRAMTGLSGTISGILLSLPTLAFALLGMSSPVLVRRLGSHLLVLVCLAAIIAGQLLRAIVSGTAALFGGSMLALAGIAVGNVLLPSLVRLHFPDRIGAMTAAYTTLLVGGGALSAAVSVPIESALDGDWRTAIGVWVIPAALAAIPWLAMSRQRPGVWGGVQTVNIRAVARTRIGWSLAIYFGVQSLLAYVMYGWLSQILTERGLSPTLAALQVGIVAAISVPMAALAPTAVSRMRSPTGLVIALAACYIIGFVGLIAVLGRGVMVFTVLIGIGGGAFPLALTFVAARARTPTATLSLSAFTQSVGYLIASIGPFGFGVLHDAVGGWRVPLIVLSSIAVIQATFGIASGRKRFVEDQLTISTPAVATRYTSPPEL